jgi:hypothetical protein
VLLRIVEGGRKWGRAAGLERAELLAKGEGDKGVEGELEEAIGESNGLAGDGRLSDNVDEDDEVVLYRGGDDRAERSGREAVRRRLASSVPLWTVGAEDAGAL